MVCIFALASGPQDMRRADRDEAALLRCYGLTVDPFVDCNGDQLNLPLLAFSYLLRRFMVNDRS